jgi:site-specific recombinase XerD
MERDATISVVLYKSKTLSNGEHPLVLRVSKNGKRKHISLGISCKPKFWDSKNQRPRRNHPDLLLLESIIAQKKNEYRERILEYKKENKGYTPDKLVEEIEQPTKTMSVWDYFDDRINLLNRAGKVGNANAYKDAKNALVRFYGKKDLLFQDIDVRFLNKYEQWFREKGSMETTISVYFRTLRALFSRAIAEKIIPEHFYPFKDYKISKFNTKTRKQAIKKEEMQLIQHVELEEYSKIWEAQQYFIFMYYGQGINVTDMAQLQWKDVVNGRVYYVRSKTNQLIKFKVSEPLQAILEKFRLLTGYYIDNYIFPILDKEIHKTPQQIDDRVHKITGQVNKRLKDIGKLVGISIPLSTNVARHTYATVLRYAGNDQAKIGEALGHTNYRTTEIYFKSFEDEEIDKMNEDFL